MSDKRLVLIMILLQFFRTAIAQETYLRVDYAIGSYAMTDLKEFQSSNIPVLNVDIKSVSSFPPYFNYGLSLISYLRSGPGLGFVSNFSSTGARNFYGDYSGSYRFDFLARSINFGTLLSVSNIVAKDQYLNFEISQGIKFSYLALIQKLDVSGQSFIDTSLRLRSTSWWISPGIRYEHRFYRYFLAGAFLGGELNPGSKLHPTGNNMANLTDKDGNAVTINWSGVRFAVSVSVDLSIFSPATRSEVDR